MSTPLTNIPGIGPSTAEALQTHGFDSLETLAASSIEKISEVPGFGAARSAAILQAASDMASPETPEQSEEKPAKKKNKKDKDKKKKKGKKDKKKGKDKKGKKKKKK